MVTYPGDWKEKTLGDFVKIKRGASPRPIESYLTSNADGVNWIKIGDAPRFGKYITSTEERITPQGAMRSVGVYPSDFILSNSMSFGRPYILNIDGCIHDGWLRLYDFQEEADGDFLYYLLSSPYVQRQYSAFAAGSGVQNLNKEVVKKVSVFLPDLPEQEAIAEAITSFDTHIENLSALIEKKRAIRDGALEDLISGRTRLEGFNGKMAETVFLGSLQEVRRGKRLVRSQLYRNGKFPVYQNSLEPLGYFDEANCLPESAFVIAAGNAGDIGFSETAFWAADDCYYFEHCEDLCQKYLYYSLLHQQANIYAQTRRTSIPRLSRDILEKIPLLLPHVKEQEAIASVLTAMDEEITTLEAERDKYTQIREGVMDDLLTGRVRLNV